MPLDFKFEPPLTLVTRRYNSLCMYVCHLCSKCLYVCMYVCIYEYMKSPLFICVNNVLLNVCLINLIKFTTFIYTSSPPSGKEGHKT